MIKVSLYSAHRLTIFNLLMGEMHYINEVSQHAKLCFPISVTSKKRFLSG